MDSCFTNHNSSYTHLKICSTYMNCDINWFSLKILLMYFWFHKLRAIIPLLPDFLHQGSETHVEYFCCTLCTLTSQVFTFLQGLIIAFIYLNEGFHNRSPIKEKEQNIPNTILTSFICVAHSENEFILTIPIICYLR